MKGLSNRLAAVFSLLVFSSISAAAHQEPSTIYDMSLEDLLNVEITTASRKSEKISEAPAIMTLITEKDIQAYGGLSLVEILDRTTSVYFMGTTENLQGMLTIRGDATQVANNHVLVLINGRPIQESTLGGFVDPFYRSFPVESIKQIEIIRGPGSVLYGTNAYVGVVNVITKDWESGGIARAWYGTFNTKNVSAAGGKTIGDLKISGGVNYSHNDGWDFTATDTDHVTRTIPYYDRKLGSTFTAKYKDLSLNTYFSHVTSPNFTNATASPLWEESGDLKADQLMTDIGYEHSFFKPWKSAFHITFNHLDYDGTFGTAGDREIRSDDLFFEWSNHIAITDRLNVTAGASLLRRTGYYLNTTENFFEIPRYQQNDWTTYLQGDYRAFSFLKFVAGAQGISVPFSPPHYVSRLGMVANFSPNWGAKLLYSEAFRRPSTMETNRVRIDGGVITNEGNPNLYPEEIATTDLQLFYNHTHINGALTFFTNAQKGLIREIEIGGNDLVQNDSATVRTYGGELELDGMPNDSLSLESAVTYQASFDDKNRYVMPVPNVIAKFGVSYSFPFGLSAGLHDSFFSAGQPMENGFTGISKVNPSAEAFHNVTLQLSYRLRESLTAHLYASNLLNSAIYYPEHTSQSINTIPGRPGRAVYMGVSCEF